MDIELLFFASAGIVCSLQPFVSWGITAIHLTAGSAVAVETSEPSQGAPATLLPSLLFGMSYTTTALSFDISLSCAPAELRESNPPPPLPPTADIVRLLRLSLTPVPLHTFSTTPHPPPRRRFFQREPVPRTRPRHQSRWRRCRRRRCRRPRGRTVVEVDNDDPARTPAAQRPAVAIAAKSWRGSAGRWRGDQGRFCCGTGVIIINNSQEAPGC